MRSDEILVTNLTEVSAYDRLMYEAIQYAILSIPFTFDRMGIRDLKQKIINIAKGKFSESLFFNFLSNNSINVDHQTTSTPFYQIDKRDFIFLNFEWDIKNNFLTHLGEFLEPHEYLELLALVPNRAAWDQWSKRDTTFFPNTSGTGYVFTFMKKNDPGRHSDFFDISFTFEQEQFIRELYEEHGGKHKSRSPYEEAWFWGQFYDKGQEFTLTFHSRPQMVITGMAVSEHYKDFQSYKPSEIEGSFLRTIIPNMGMKIRDMVSFKEFAGISV